MLPSVPFLLVIYSQWIANIKHLKINDIIFSISNLLIIETLDVLIHSLLIRVLF